MVQLFKKILCPVDFDSNSMKALDFAISVARQNRSFIYLLHVVRPPLGEAGISPLALEPYLAWEQSARERLEEIATEKLRGKVPYELLVRSGEPAGRILKAESELDIDLIVMATRGRTGIRRLVLGSVAERIVREARKPVLTVRAVPAASRLEPNARKKSRQVGSWQKSPAGPTNERLARGRRGTPRGRAERLD
jgi:universal stress protein A